MFRPKIGLALGGGGARGFAYIGVLKILEQENIPIDIIAGTSAGAVIGAMYALDPDAKNVEQKMIDFLSSSSYKRLGIDRISNIDGGDGFFSHMVTHLKERIVINMAYSRNAVVNGRKFIAALKCIIEDKTFEDLQIPLCAVASDLKSGKNVTISSGKLLAAVTASSSIPGFLPPVNWGGKLLLDGCVTQNVPVQTALNMGADIVVAVNVAQDLNPNQPFDNVFDIVTMSSRITSHTLTNLQLQDADLVLRPKVGQYQWSQFSKYGMIIDRGTSEAKMMLPQIKKVISQKFYLRKRISPKRLNIKKIGSFSEG